MHALARRWVPREPYKLSTEFGYMRWAEMAQRFGDLLGCRAIEPGLRFEPALCFHTLKYDLLTISIISYVSCKLALLKQLIYPLTAAELIGVK